MCLVGVVVRRHIDFLMLLIPIPLVSAFLQQHPYFFFIFLNVFRSCSNTFLNNFPPQYKQIYGGLRASHGSFMKGRT